MSMKLAIPVELNDRSKHVIYTPIILMFCGEESALAQLVDWDKIDSIDCCKTVDRDLVNQHSQGLER